VGLWKTRIRAFLAASPSMRRPVESVLPSLIRRTSYSAKRPSVTSTICSTVSTISVSSFSAGTTSVIVGGDCGRWFDKVVMGLPSVSRNAVDDKTRGGVERAYHCVRGVRHAFLVVPIIHKYGFATGRVAGFDIAPPIADHHRCFKIDVPFSSGFKEHPGFR